MLSQQNRIGRLTTPMGIDILCLVELQAEEGLSRLFEFDVVAVAEDANLDIEALIGKPCAVEIDAGAAGKRWFHGLVAEGEWNEQVETLSYYRLRLRPWCWLLTKTADCRIHHDKTVVQILRDTFADHGFTDFKLVLTQSYPTLHYTVQYCESDWSFACRLMELHGIYFFFEHSGDKHMLVLADAYAAHAAEKPARSLQFNASDAQALAAMRRPYVSRWSPRRRLRSGRFEITDYNHLTPAASQKSTRPNPHNYAHGHYEVFDWPGPYVDRDQGDAYVRVLTEAEEALDGRRTAEGVAASVFPGVLVELFEHPRMAENGEYLTVAMKSHVGPQEYRSRALKPDVGFASEYEFQPAKTAFRAPLDTPKPLVHSLQTATVVGQEGEEIDCDDHGRILVHFFWDRHGDRSCRVRVTQVWGGQSWGAQTIPRIGMEVLVAYIDGDPDRPIVVGTAPNPETLTVPYELPVKKTKMALRSKTNKAAGFNELTFEDENGAQNLFMHAEKDRTEKTRNNHTHRVDANSLHSIGANHSLQIANNMSHQVGGGVSQIIGLPPEAVAAVDAAPATLLNTDSGAGMAGGGASLAEAVAGMVGSGVLNQLITKFHNTTTGVAKIEDIGVSDTLSVGVTKTDTIGKHYKIVVGETFEIIVGKSRFFMDKDGNVSVIGVHHTHVASGPIQMNGQIIDLNP